MSEVISLIQKEVDLLPTEEEEEYLSIDLSQLKKAKFCPYLKDFCRKSRCNFFYEGACLIVEEKKLQLRNGNGH